MAFEDYVVRRWYSRWPLWWGIPFSWLYRAINGGKRSLYRLGLKKSWRAPVPVIIVGNITVGGTGKTPVVIGLVEALREKGYQPGVISRGYGGSAEAPTLVTTDTPPALVGDEPYLIAQRTECPVAINRDRQASTTLLLQQHPHVNVIIADDGLQHLRLARDIEIVVVDGQRQFGNGWQIPAGPLRDPIGRLRSVHAILQNGGEQPSFELRIQSAQNIATGEVKPLADLGPAHAIAGIGNPRRFFEALASQQVNLRHTQAFPDHHEYSESDWGRFDGDDLPILMTEKDAVKCATLKNRHRFWSVPANTVMDDNALQPLFDTLQKLHEPRHIKK